MTANIMARRRGVPSLALVAAALGMAEAGHAEPPREAVGVAPIRTDQDSQLNARDQDAWEALRLAADGQADKAMAAARRMLATQRALVGDGHEDVAGALEFLANIAKQALRFEEARDALAEALAIRTKARGADDWRTVDTRYSLERTARLVGLDDSQRKRYGEAERILNRANQLGKSYEANQRIELERKALALQKEALGEENPEVAFGLERLARSLLSKGDFREQSPTRQEAEALYLQAQAIRERALGKRHPEYALSLEDRFRSLPSDKAPARVRGEPLLREVVAIRKAKQGTHHPDYTRSLVSLGQCLEWKADGTAEAEALYREALQLERQIYGPDSPRLTNTLIYLGRLYETKLGALDRAQPFFEERVRIHRKDFAEGRWPSDGRWANPLGRPPETDQNRYSLLWVSFVKREVLASALRSLAQVHGEKGDLAAAGRYLGESLDVLEEGFKYRAAVLAEKDYSERYSSIYTQAFNAFLAVSLDPRSNLAPDDVYQHVLARKGAHFAYERRVRELRRRPELAPRYTELQEVSTDVARRSTSPPAPGDSAGWRELYSALKRKDNLELELANHTIRIGLANPSATPVINRLKQALPSDVALVDFLVAFTRIPWKGGGGGGYDLLAFVVRNNQPTVQIDLGPIAAIEQTIDSWRIGAQQARNPTNSARVRQVLWTRLEPALAGARTVLLSPDAALCRFPFAALPGKAPGTFLIEDLGLAIVPVPQLLVSEGTAPTSPPRLLLAGDINFDADPGPASPPGERLAPKVRVRLGSPGTPKLIFPALPGTAREIDAVRERFQATHPGVTAQILRGAAATERAFREALPGARFVHLATHGFFQRPPPGLPSANPNYWNSAQALADLTPSLLSGITFTGANRPPRPDRDDGILTALEAQQLDFSATELAVLSACETSLGSATKGEGLMGLQRAFQVAGAHALVSTLWKVDDSATAVLMDEFYTNLWVRRMSKLEALRQAQIAVLTRYDPDTNRLLRGAEVDRTEPPGAKTQGGTPTARRLPPYFWAPFVLSGDWR